MYFWNIIYVLIYDIVMNLVWFYWKLYVNSNKYLLSGYYALGVVLNICYILINIFVFMEIIF